MLYKENWPTLEPKLGDVRKLIGVAFIGKDKKLILKCGDFP